jgi:hypothetical protein
VKLSFSALCRVQKQCAASHRTGFLISDDPGAAKVTTSIFSFLENSYQRALPLNLSIFTHSALLGSPICGCSGPCHGRENGG